MWVKNWRFGKLFLYLWLELIVCQYVNRKEKRTKNATIALGIAGVRICGGIWTETCGQDVSRQGDFRL